MNAGEWAFKNWAAIEARLPSDKTPVLGIAGSQGSGKSWLARYIAATHPGNVVIFSLDDFYLSKQQRAALAGKIHANLSTRGVPGTHDAALLSDALVSAQSGRRGQGLMWPRFDKVADDRLPEAQWNIAALPIDLIILEGWCIGARPQKQKALADPINAYERETDPNAVWRGFVNTQLAGPYKALFQHIDLGLFLRAPDFETVLRWRLEQEAGNYAAQGMDMPPDTPAKIDAFIQGYERLTRHMIAGNLAQITLGLGQQREIVKAPAWSQP